MCDTTTRYYLCHYDTFFMSLESVTPLPDHNRDEAIAAALDDATSIDWYNQSIEVQVCVKDGYHAYLPIAYADMDDDGNVFMTDILY